VRISGPNLRPPIYLCLEQYEHVVQRQSVSIPNDACGFILFTFLYCSIDNKFIRQSIADPKAWFTSEVTPRNSRYSALCGVIQSIQSVNFKKNSSAQPETTVQYDGEPTPQTQAARAQPSRSRTRAHGRRSARTRAARHRGYRGFSGAHRYTLRPI
jgi:hypothetical protein